MNKLKCIYAILDTDKDLGLDLKGLDDSYVYTLTCKDISAAVSDIDKGNLKVNEECAVAYGKIIENMMREYTLLPMRFGTLVKEDREVIAILEKYYDGFIDNLRQIKGKLEYGLKVLLDIKEAGFEINSSSETKDSKSFDRLKGGSPYKKYLLEKLREHKFEEALMGKVGRIIEDIHNPLKELSSLSKFKKMATKRIILDAAYLVEKKKKDVFIQRFKGLCKRHQKLKFLLTGPWPPYNFASLDSRHLTGFMEPHAHARGSS